MVSENKKITARNKAKINRQARDKQFSDGGGSVSFSFSRSFSSEPRSSSRCLSNQTQSLRERVDENPTSISEQIVDFVDALDKKVERDNGNENEKKANKNRTKFKVNDKLEQVNSEESASFELLRSPRKDGRILSSHQVERRRSCLLIDENNTSRLMASDVIRARTRTRTRLLQREEGRYFDEERHKIEEFKSELKCQAKQEAQTDLKPARYIRAPVNRNNNNNNNNNDKCSLRLLIFAIITISASVGISRATALAEESLEDRATLVKSYNNYQSGLGRNNNENHARQRTQRQLSLNQWRNEPPAQQQNVPYKTFYVSRACEWKSNLFVPKSNDIHFAQLPQLSDQHQPQHQHAVESSVAYETINNKHLLPGTGADRSNQQHRASTLAQPQQQAGGFHNNNNHNQQQVDQSRTMLFTDSKALILALPIVMSPSFAGYEPACSIRLIVPRNMRILAKLTSRRLTFAQEQLDVDQQAQSQSPFGGFQAPAISNNMFQYNLNQQHPPMQRQLWLNVSQNQFIETEQRIIETDGNVLAFRFLLERFANKQFPDTRFQVVLTAFQTLGENSDLATLPAGNRQRPSSSSAFNALDSNAQFICDQQRLISANLACDGFKNCQDGQDEESATCAAFRPQHPSEQLPGISGIDFAGTGRNQVFHESANNNDNKKADAQPAPPFVLIRFWQAARDTNSVFGFLLGFILVLLLLSCCTCCFYFVYVFWKKQYKNYNRRRRQEESTKQGTLTKGRRTAKKVAGASKSSGDEMDSLAAQNVDNAARLAKYVGQQQQSHGQRLPSILKKPPTRPVEPPPAVPARRQQQQSQEQQSQSSPIKRGALSSSLSSSSRGSFNRTDFKPTPAKRLTRPTRPVPIPVQVSQQEALTSYSNNQHRSLMQPASPTSTGATGAPSGGGASLFNPSYMRLLASGPTSGGLHTNSTSTNITSSHTGNNERVTTYHYSSGSTRYSESYLQRLATESSSAVPTTTTTNAASRQPGQPYRAEPAGEQTKKNNSSPSQSSLI